jgi:outer membrane lipoprotein-sorting protein
MKRVLVALWLAACAFAPGVAIAETDEEKGLRIATEADDYDAGFGDQVTEFVMLLRNRYGDESSRFFRNKTLEVQEDGDKSIAIFDQPNDIKGTAVLTFTHKSGPDDQWLYLPALARVKRISSANKSGSFVGSEFAYEDLSSQEVEKYTYKWIEDTTCGDGLDCWVFERYPVDKYSGYTRQVVWMDKEAYRVHKIDYYDRKNDPLKTLTFEDYRQYLDHYWRSKVLNMVNHQTGKSTTLTSEGIEFRTGLTERDFDTTALKRTR